MIRLLLIYLLLFTPVADTLQLKIDFERDRRQILGNQHGILMDKEGKLGLRVFRKYADMNLSGFKFSKVQSGQHTIIKWKAPQNNLEICQIRSVTPSYTVYDQFDVDGNKQAVKEKGPNIVFYTYIIMPKDADRLIYFTQRGEGLQHYTIGKKRFRVIREAIPLGVKYPDEKELLELAARD
ncbi:hypothetical protein [Mucilaginibacter pedocola]|uniref:Uncharacterized protein n=1 Tax=Mucilaginibacter pedocola TaxID=1792845 RepID=A0A1S9PDT1_9SPHI|nr:hypothetical protein [Mucilaginibacter pedocola]OOQ59131.1 hypothetical protein BC343_29350 [Mucilaginibacter pedocola]